MTESYPPARAVLNDVHRGGAAKLANAYCITVGKSVSGRSQSHDLAFHSDEWLYRDSYFGGTDFLRQRTVWFQAEPVWAENYYGYILRPDLIDAARVGAYELDHCGGLIKA